MMRMTSAARLPIRIRGGDSWLHERGRESDHLGLLPADQTELARLADVITFETRGSHIVSQGESARFLFLLSDGVLTAAHMLSQGDRQVVAFYWPGDLFGLAEMGMYVNSIETVAASTVFRFPLKELETFLLLNPRIQQRFLTKTVHDLRSTQRQLIVMGRFDVVKRLAVFLLDCSGHETFYDRATGTLALPMRRNDIADYLGTSAESVARAMTSLEGRGLIRRIAAQKIELRLKELETFTDLR